MLFKFNWFELLRMSEKQPEGIITLTFALTKEYNSVISFEDVALLKLLHIDRFPKELIERGYLTRRGQLIYRSFKVKDPQCWFKDTSWLFEQAAMMSKVTYLYALSHRSLKNKQMYIPENYIERSLWNNTFLNHQNKKLIFIPEYNYTRRKILKET